MLPAEPTPEQRQQAREQLLDPQRNVALLAGKMARLSTALGIPSGHLLETSNGYRDAHWIATLAYLHNGKLDYPARILGYMQDPPFTPDLRTHRSAHQPGDLAAQQTRPKAVSLVCSADQSKLRGSLRALPKSTCRCVVMAWGSIL